MSNGHATYSPSSSDRWTNCSGSVRLSIGLPPVPDSAASIEGTNTHSLLERKLKEEPITARFKKEIAYNPKMETNASFAAKVVRKELTKVDNPRNVTFEVEGKSDISHLVDGDMWGTSDVIIAEEFSTLHIMDYKNGVKKVQAKENTQGLAYALGIADRFNYNFERYKFTIIQPNVSQPLSSWTFDYKRLILQRDIFRQAVKATKSKTAPVKAGSWCWFCPANYYGVCPLAKEKALDKARDIFK